MFENRDSTVETEAAGTFIWDTVLFKLHNDARSFSTETESTVYLYLWLYIGFGSEVETHKQKDYQKVLLIL